MKKLTIILLMSVVSVFLTAQMQIENSGFEEWEDVTGGTEPVNWNGFLTASGAMASFADVQLEVSSDTRPGSSGTKSARIWSRSILGITANGNMTLGRVNMGSSNPTAPENFNRTVRSNPEFHQVLTNKPDSIVFWAKFIPNGHNQNARMIATIHDDYDYRDPEDEESTQHVVGIAELNYPSTNEEWKRMAVPFVYTGPATDAKYILLTFATNETPGGGAANDQVWIDDVQLIYNSLGIEKNNALEQINVYPNPVSNIVTVQNLKGNVNYSILSVLGSQITEGTLSEVSNKLDFSKYKKGIYFIQLTQDKSFKTLRIIKK